MNRNKQKLATDTDLQDYARKVNNHMCESSPTGWGNLNCQWRAVPSHEMRTAMALMKRDCEHLFKIKESKTNLEEAIQGRLYQARRNWQQISRRATRRKTDTEEADREMQPSTEGASSERHCELTNQLGEDATSRRKVMEISSLLLEPSNPAIEPSAPTVA